MSTIRIPGLRPYTPRRGISVMSVDPKAYYEAERELAREHVMHVRNMGTDPWAEPETVPADPLLRQYYAKMIETERNLFIVDSQLCEAEVILARGATRFFIDETQSRWEGWLTARLGFLPEKTDD